MALNDTFTGRAYGFLYYAGRTERLRRALPYLKEDAFIPAESTLDLVEGVQTLKSYHDSALVDIIQTALRKNLNHALVLAIPGMGNREVALQLGDLMGLIYNHGAFYSSSEPFNAEIVYKRGNQYVVRRK